MCLTSAMVRCCCFVFFVCFFVFLCVCFLNKLYYPRNNKYSRVRDGTAGMGQQGCLYFALKVSALSL